ncbi:permease prefix domain 1-containing protein [Alkalihalobacillus pseudalcaliphilus]|uniref:permease prefix domain 1-containing protein n=1 Tax=Alkalihalobacillus pseudalcaliphilus TaxID=79884 RepID=UPI00064D86BA|nr:permease prefix domain 1-containing protein [Alkalihalobacillus pseudalcaliphilus]KMK78139.1 hypothetical protein AB990_01485 [Alkalihalobacillus pseudalcaliphilus]
MNHFFNRYLDKVTAQIRSKEGQRLVKKELHSHLRQSKQANMRSGLTEEESEQKAVLTMGDPVQLGKGMNKLYRPLVDWWMLFLVMGIFVLSFAPYFLVEIQAMRFEAQFISVLLSMLFLFGFMYIDFRKILFYWKWFIGAAFLYIWLFLVGITLHSSYIYHMHVLAKFQFFGVKIPHQWFIILIFIGLIGYMTHMKITTFKQMIPIFILMWLPVMVMADYLSPFLSLLLLFLVVVLVIFSPIVKKLKYQFLYMNSIFIGLTALWFMITMEHRVARIVGWINQTINNADSYIYILLQDMVQASSWFGQSEVIWSNYMDDMHTVTALALIIYYGGWVLAGLILLVFVAILIRLAKMLMQMNHQQAKLLLAGGIVLLASPFLYNTLMIFGLMPYSAVNFPMISYGGFERIYYASVIGMMLSVYRQKLFLDQSTVSS